jgi:hypothetical protein
MVSAVGIGFYAFSCYCAGRGLGRDMYELLGLGGRVEAIAWYWLSSFLVPIALTLHAVRPSRGPATTLHKVLIVCAVLNGGVHACLSGIMLSFQGTLDDGLVTGFEKSPLGECSGVWVAYGPSCGTTEDGPARVSRLTRPAGATC